MKSLFNPSDTQELLERLNKLTPSSKAEWGKMSVSQMFAHSSAALESAFGDIKLKRTLIGRIFGKMAKKRMLSDKPIDKNLPTDKNFKQTFEPDFGKEKEKLTGLIKRFYEAGEAGVSSEPHPFFGEMSPDEWDVLMYKHLDHHLKQFGV